MTPRVLRAAVPVLLAAWVAGPAHAELSDVSPGGFTTSFREEVAATPEQVWTAITQLPRWWSDAHTYSGKAASMSLDLHAGGCWCERWGDGRSVLHGQVVLVQPGRVIRLFASLGPLLELPANGVLTLVTSAQDGKTFLRMTYRVAGAPGLGLDKLAEPVDKVMGEGFRRLKSFAQTGRAD